MRFRKIPFDNDAYEAWEASDSQRRGLIVSLEYREAGEIKYLRVSNVRIPQTEFELTPCLLSDVKLETSLGDGAAFTTIKLANDGRFDHLLHKSWEGGNVTVYLGPENYGDGWFVPFARFTNEGLSANSEVIEFSLTTKIANLDIPASTARSDTGLEIPIVLGVVKNLEPVLVDPQTLTYQVSAEPVTDIVVRDNGVVIGATVDLAGGKFTLDASPIGEITADVTDWRDTAESQLSWISSNVDIDVDFEILFTSSFVSSQCGILATNSVTLLQMAQEICASFGATPTVNALGFLEAKFLKAPNLTDYVSISRSAIKEDSIEIVGSQVPYKQIEVRYSRLQKTQSEANLAGSLTVQDKSNFTEAYKTVVVENDVPDFPTATNKVVNTVFMTRQAAEVEANRLAQLFSVQRFTYKFSACMGSFSKVGIGDTISVDLSFSGDGQESKYLVIGKTYDFDSNEVQLEVWA